MAPIRNLTRDDVIWSFQAVFGRQIEEEFIQHFLESEEDLGSLLKSLLVSNEYRKQFDRSQSDGGPARDLDGFKYDDRLEIQRAVLDVLKLIPVKTVVGFQKTRVGSLNDGGYIMLDDFDGIEAA